MQFSKKYPILFSPLKVNRMVLKNRIIGAPVGQYDEKASNGFAMIIRGVVGNVDGPRMRAGPGKFYLDDPRRRLELLQELAYSRQRGAKASIELSHCGMHAFVPKGDYVIGPTSGVRSDGIEIRQMDEDMMREVCDQYASAARKFRDIGYDCIMIHADSGWLISQFLSPLTNTRTDGYGGTIENRIRFPRMIIEAVRKAVGPDFPLDMRISINDYIDGSCTEGDTIPFVQGVEDLVDMVSVSCGYLDKKMSGTDPVSSYSHIHKITPTYYSHLVNVKYSEMLKKVLHIPVSVVGAIMTPEEAEQILAEGKADAVVIGRAGIADPLWAKKALEDRADDIIPCIRCMKCKHESCTVNPRINREYLFPAQLDRAEQTKKVVVVGGGPGGMKAALTCSERGHEVILIEKSDRLGGLIKCADYDPHKADLKRYKDYAVRKIETSSVSVMLNTEATPELVRSLEPETLILAMGANPVMLPIPGAELAHVVQAVDAYPQLDQIGQRVVIVGGGTVGCELALTLGSRGKDVTIVELTDKLDAGNQVYMRWGLYFLLKELPNVRAYVNTICKSISGDTVELEGAFTGRVPADTVVLSAGFKADSNYAYTFFGITPDTTVIGDLYRPASMEEAIFDAYNTCAKL